MFDLVIAGGELVDGTGTLGSIRDVGVIGDRIAAVGDLAVADAAERIHASGLTVVPGFVDLHSHSDLTLLSDGRATSRIGQGITTEVIGNCGMSPVPSPHAVAARAAVRRAVGVIDLDPAVPWPWTDFEGYEAAVSAARPVVDLVPLIGHVALRVAVSGDRAGVATSEDRAAMEAALGELLEQGAAGCSTGLMYPPASGADAAELDGLARVVKRHDRLFAIHMRDYAGGLLAAVDEAIGIARRTGVRLQVSHLAVAGRRNWGSVATAVERIAMARAEGLDIACDIYPYLAGSANLSQLLPTWAQAGGSDTIAASLHDHVVRARILAEWASSLHLGWDEIELSLLVPGMESWIGRTVVDIAAEAGRPPGDMALDLIRDTADRAMMVAYGRSQQDLDAVLTAPFASIGSDGFALVPGGPASTGRPHPRSFGCYPRLLGRTVREDGRLAFERAIAMSTSMPAARAGLTDRGKVTPGALADLVVLDRGSILDTATFADPLQLPVGIRTVIRRGKLALADGRQREDVRPGRLERLA